MGKQRGEIRDYRDLRVWQVAVDLVERIYDVTRPFPRHEMFGLAGQMQRAAVSVSANIAEGHTREYTKEYLKHISVARGSLAEVQTLLEIAARLGYISRDECQQVLDEAFALGRQLTTLRNALSRRI